ncbi:MAG TPA: putative sugar O-methyltransferase, partial [Rhabdochlamydiaceae bacterium]
MRNIFLTMGLVALGSVSASTSVSDHDSYRSFCLSAANNPKVFYNFKQNWAYTEILEHLGKEAGQRYLDYISKYYPHLLQDFKKFQENDRLGSPLVFHYPTIGVTGPTTLRYVKVLGDLESNFGNLTSKKIIEIGGGYGGQCLVVSKACNFEKYCIVDLPEPMMLAKKYLNSHSVANFQCLNPDDLRGQESWDLVISNYAFS